MNISTCIRPSHDAALLDAARVACLLVSEPDDSCHRDTPENCDRSRNVLFAASATLDGGQTRLDALAEHYRCDAVDVIREADGGFHFRMGYRLFWKVLWHDHDYRLWRPRNGTAACFVSAGPTHDMWFRMEGYRLRPGIDDRPWADQQERLLGLYLGAAALQRLAGGALIMARSRSLQRRPPSPRRRPSWIR